MRAAEKPEDDEERQPHKEKLNNAKRRQWLAKKVHQRTERQLGCLNPADKIHLQRSESAHDESGALQTRYSFGPNGLDNYRPIALI